ncbi:S-adenosyl-L-methionine-dependent methyltransferase [Cunninghamella echinulata]|nr:S-adenosyl-L-methionine-dependent methyltransferase [Cunninghamella echinulata]
MDSIKFIQHKKFLASIIEIIDSKFFSANNGRVVRVLDIGCGPGDFATLLKNHYKEKIDLVGIDPSEKDIKEAKTKTNEVSFYQNGIVDWYSEHKDEAKFDLVLFTKSLHHCDDLEKSIQAAYDSLNANGLLFADEMDLHNLDKATIYWFMERLDLIKASGRLGSQEKPSHDHQHGHQHHHHSHDNHNHNHNQEHDHDHGHGHDANNFRAKILDETVDPFERFSDFRNHPHIHKPDAVINAFKSIFGAEKVKFTNNTPFIYYILIPFGLEDSEAGKKILNQFLTQEERAIANGTIKAAGFNITIEK